MIKKSKIKIFAFLCLSTMLFNSTIVFASETNIQEETQEILLPSDTQETIILEQESEFDTNIEESVILEEEIAPNIVEENIVETETQDIILYEYSSTIAQGEVISEIMDTNGIKTITYSLGQHQEEPQKENIEVNLLQSLTTTGLNATFTNAGITIDGNYDDWSDKPIFYEYNWDNSHSCWYWGEWYNGIKYTTPEGTYDNNVRHAMQLAFDDEYVYLHIKFAKIYDSKFNGEDYRFYFDGVESAFQITDLNGYTITNNLNYWESGTYQVVVRHRESSISWLVADGSNGYLTKYPNNENADLEIKIPLSEFKRQNPNINIEKINEIQYSCPNLTYRRISAYGSNTGIVIGVVLSISIVSFSLLYKKKKGKNNEQCKKKDTNSLTE